MWDHVCGFDTALSPEASFDELVSRATRMVYIKHMEGYYIWRQNGNPETGSQVKCPGIGHPVCTPRIPLSSPHPFPTCLVGPETADQCY